MLYLWFMGNSKRAWQNITQNLHSLLLSTSKDALRRVLPSISPEYYMFKYNWLASANVLISVCIDTPCVVVSKALNNPSSSHPLPTCCQCQVLEYDNKRKITVIRTMPNCHIVVVICTSIVVRIWLEGYGVQWPKTAIANSIPHFSLSPSPLPPHTHTRLSAQWQNTLTMRKGSTFTIS